MKWRVTGVHTHKTEMDLHDQTQDVKGKFRERKLHDEMIVKRTTLQFNKRKDSTLYLKNCKILKMLAQPEYV